jgi:hypothetical protein
MPLDVYACYQRLCQQKRRARTQTERKDRGRICKLVKAMFRRGTTEEQRLALAERAAALEAELPFGTYRFASKILEALQAAEADFDTVPYPKRHALEETQRDTGYIYCAVAASRPGQVKLGSSVDPWKRLKLYSRKYDYETTVYWAVRVKRPRSLEKRMEKALAEYRVAHSTSGDSNEWYRLSAAEMQTILESEIAERRIAITQ